MESGSVGSNCYRKVCRLSFALGIEVKILTPIAEDCNPDKNLDKLQARLERREGNVQKYLSIFHKQLYIPEDVDPPFRFMLTHHSGDVDPPAYLLL